jgi:hypothetical protein
MLLLNIIGCNRVDVGYNIEYILHVVINIIVFTRVDVGYITDYIGVVVIKYYCL